MSRINWTQTTTITIAAFIGCLGAFAILIVVYKRWIGQAIQKQTAQLDNLEHRVGQAYDELREVNNDVVLLNKRRDEAIRKASQSPIRSTPSYKLPVETDPVLPIDDQDYQLDDDDDEPPMTGPPVPTIPTV